MYSSPCRYYSSTFIFCWDYNLQASTNSQFNSPPTSPPAKSPLQSPPPHPSPPASPAHPHSIPAQTPLAQFSSFQSRSRSTPREPPPSAHVSFSSSLAPAAQNLPNPPQPASTLPTPQHR